MDDHPYTYDRWAAPDDPEFAVVRVADLRKMERACEGIWAIARIVGNGLNESGFSATRPLNAWVVTNLMGSVESICNHLVDLVVAAIDEPLPNLTQSTTTAVRVK
ncbi:hypothetical protein [Achromobacter piechaudii]|uniref:hypothetical protein n=1 Tax=Achromobacter piechaudii TaxID=72556 RepID=UPI001583CF82|nr:hypothetical protein [Achromobacter piechaudii]